MQLGKKNLEESYTEPPVSLHISLTGENNSYKPPFIEYQLSSSHTLLHSVPLTTFRDGCPWYIQFPDVKAKV